MWVYDVQEIWLKKSFAAFFSHQPQNLLEKKRIENNITCVFFKNPQNLAQLAQFDINFDNRHIYTD